MKTICLKMFSTYLLIGRNEILKNERENADDDLGRRHRCLLEFVSKKDAFQIENVF